MTKAAKIYLVVLIWLSALVQLAVLLSYYLNSDSDLTDSVKCDCLLSHSGIVQNEIAGNDLFC